MINEGLVGTAVYQTTSCLFVFLVVVVVTKTHVPNGEQFFFAWCHVGDLFLACLIIVFFSNF